MSTTSGFTELGLQWLQTTGQHLTANSRSTYRNCILNAGKCILGINGRLPEDLALWQRERRPPVLSSASFGLELQVVKAVLNWSLKTHGTPAVDCWSSIKAGRIENEVFDVPSKEQFDAIIAHIRRQDNGIVAADFVELLGTSGCRYSEACALHWRDIDFKANTFKVSGKTGRRVVPLFPALRTVLNRIQERNVIYAGLDDLVFIEEIQPRSRIDKACDELHLPHFRTHDMRHYFAVTALRAIGIERAHVSAAWLGHSVTVHLNRYTRHIEGNQSQELAKLIR